MRAIDRFRGQLLSGGERVPPVDSIAHMFYFCKGVPHPALPKSTDLGRVAFVRGWVLAIINVNPGRDGNIAAGKRNLVVIQHNIPPID